MTTEPLLQPTLWRTCRVLANRTRLRIFGLLVQHSPQTVSALAGRLQLSVPVACQSLRALEARGLLTARRTGRLVHYRLSTTTAGTVHELVAPLRAAFQRGPSSVNTLFRLATAFTHPRRIDIFRTLQTGAGTLRQIQAATHPCPVTWGNWRCGASWHVEGGFTRRRPRRRRSDGHWHEWQRRGITLCKVWSR